MQEMAEIIIEGRLCVLGEMKEEYLLDHTKYLNDPEVNQFIYSRPPFTVDQQRQWLKNQKEAGDYIHAVLVRKNICGMEKFVFVGVVDLRNINFAEKTAYSGSVIGDKYYWGKGIAHEAKLLQLKIAFDNLGLKYVYSKTIRPNIRSQKFLEKTGYKIIGEFPKARSLDGIYQDEFLYCVSRESWFSCWDDYYSLKTLNNSVKLEYQFI